MTRHRPIVASAIARGAGLVYRMRCTCGTCGADQPTRGLAARDLDAHLTALPLVPPGQQCRDPHRHDVRPWEPCELCAAQLPLFDLEMTA